MTQSLSNLASSQDGLLTRTQALTAMSVGELRHQLSRRWSRTLPGVYATFRGPLTLRQRCRAALLYGGDDAQLADLTALARYGVRYLPDEPDIHILIPAAQHRLSRGFVVVRRTHRLPPALDVDGLRYSPPARALLEAVARIGDPQTAHAVLTDAVGRRLTAVGELVAEAAHVTGLGSGVARRAVEDVAGGARSAPEIDFLKLCQRTRELPRPMLNPLLELPNGKRVSPDALFPGSPLVHETNGRAFHSSEDTFESMQTRHDAMTAAGLTVLHNSPRRIRNEPATVLDEVLGCYRRLAGQGLPEGVRLIRSHAA